MLRQAVSARSLTGARDVARVIDSRVRRVVPRRPPAVPAAWADRRPVTDDPELARYLAALAAAMDDRTRRIGEHASETEPAWAISSLGKPPIDPAARQRWQQRAATIGACRELYGHDSRTDAIGPEPARTSPEAWAGWHAAFTALDRTGGLDLRGASTAQLRLRRATYPRELTWAPPHVAEELRLARLQARTAWEHAIRAEHAPAAISPQAAARHRELARVWHAMHAKATTIAAILADAQETRRQWAALTEPTRTMAIAADLELRRRHPDTQLEPLSGTEPGQAATSPGDAEWIRQAFTVTAAAGKVPGQERQDLDFELIPSRSAHASRLADLAELDIDADVAGRLARIADRARQAQQQLDCLAAMPEFADEEQSVCTRPAWDLLARRERDAILQPPRPEITPASPVLELARTAAAQADFEAEPG